MRTRVNAATAVRLAVAAALAMALLLDLLSTRGAAADAVLAGSLSVGVLALAGTRRLPATGTAVACGVLSLMGTVVLRLTAPLSRAATWGLFETLGLLVLLAVVARQASGRAGGAAVGLVTAAVVVVPSRLHDADAVTFGLLGALAAACVVAVGRLRRTDDRYAQQALRQVVADERRDIARDLHDDVAHHVTGVIVTAQAATATHRQDPAAQQDALHAIERAGHDALRAMRELVGVLRDPGLVPGATSAPPCTTVWPEDLRDLVDAFAATTGLPGSLTVAGPGVDGAHRHAVRRVVQEALTNTARHARNATRVDVFVDHGPSRLLVRVTDDGEPAGRTGRALPGRAGGYGLAGVRERAAALGGTASVGPAAPRGWQVEMALPAPDTSSGPDRV